MDGYSSPRDQLWYFALQLVQETQSIPDAQQEEHRQRIQAKYNELVISLSCLGDIIAAMYQEEKLTLKELEQIQHLESTPIRANEELLNMIARKPRDVYECFLSSIKDTKQLHLYQMLVSADDDTSDKANTEDVSYHKGWIRRNFMWLSEKMDTENGLIALLYQQNALTVRERERIFCMKDAFQKNEVLLGLISKKSLEDFEKFLKALEASGQSHLTRELRKPRDLPADQATLPSVDSTPKSICHKQLPKQCLQFRHNPVRTRTFPKPVLPRKTTPESGQNLFPSSASLKPPLPPKPSVKSNSAQHYHAKTMHNAIVAKPTTGTYIRRAEEIKFQSSLKGQQIRLQTDISIKASSLSLACFDTPVNKPYFHTLLQECHQMRKEIVSLNDERKMELEKSRENARQYSAAAALNEALRTQLHSVQQELTCERLQSKRERMNLEEKISKLKTEVHNEKVKCKQLEEKENLLDDTVFNEARDSLNKKECDEESYQQQIRELNNDIASIEYELQKSKANFEESNAEVILLRTERQQLKDALKNDQTLRLEEELRFEKYRTQDLENQLKQLTRKHESRNITDSTQDGSPALFETITPKGAKGKKKSVEGMTILDNELFVVSEMSSQVEVYDSVKLRFSRRWNLTELVNCLDIGSSSKNKCLYIFDVKGIDETREILRVDPNGNLIQKWPTDGDWGSSLSVTAESNVILTALLKSRLYEYMSDGQLIREIGLSSYAGLRSPLHAIKLTNGCFVVSHGLTGDNRVWIVDEDGKLKKSFRGKPESTEQIMNNPVYLAVDGNGSVLVVVRHGSQVLLLDSDLKLKRNTFLKVKHLFSQSPKKILLDESNGRVLVIESKWGSDGRILIFQFNS